MSRFFEVSVTPAYQSPPTSRRSQVIDPQVWGAEAAALRCRRWPSCQDAGHRGRAALSQQQSWLAPSIALLQEVRIVNARFQTSSLRNSSLP